MSEGFSQFTINQAKVYGLEEHLFAVLIIFLLGGAFGGILGWLAAHRKMRAETEKLKQEALKATGENFEKLSQLRDKNRSDQESLDLSLVSLRDALSIKGHKKRNGDGLRSCRDEVCNIYANSYLPSLINYVEQIPCLVPSREARLRAKTELVPRLETILKVLKMVNMEVMLQKSGSMPLKLHPERWSGLLNRTKALVPLWSISLRWKIRKINQEAKQYLREN